jgi:tryptophan 2,3-dioxygenase
LLSAQKPLSNPVHHDELLFIVQHQTSELWMKLMIHELREAIRLIRLEDLSQCFKILARVKMIQRQLFEQWGVLETMTPSEYLGFRPVLANSSGFQSFQYRTIEFLLGNKNGQMTQVFRYDDQLYQSIVQDLNSPSIWDEFLIHLSKRGFSVPPELVARNWAEPYQVNEGLLPVFKMIYLENDLS